MSLQFWKSWHGKIHVGAAQRRMLCDIRWSRDLEPLGGSVVTASWRCDICWRRGGVVTIADGGGRGDFVLRGDESREMSDRDMRIAEARNKFNAIRFAALAEYERAKAEAIIQYEKALAPARAEYEKAMTDPSRAEGAER